MSNNSAYQPASERRSVIAALVVFLGSLTGLRAASPPNDNFVNATVLTGTNLVVTGSNLGASKEAGEPNHGEEPGGRSVWWRWTAPGSGSVIIRTAGSSFDTLLGVYTGSVVSNLTIVASNDDFGYLKSSIVGFDVTPGTTYSIAVDGYNARFGDIQMTLDYYDQPLQRPPNDNFADRISLRGTAASSVATNLFASREPGEPYHADIAGGASLWWTWTPPVSGAVTIKTAGSNFDTLLAVYTGHVLTNLTLVASNDDVAVDVDPTSLVTFAAVANTPYQIAVDGYDGEPGEIHLQILMNGVVWLDISQAQSQGPNLTLTGQPGKQVIFETSTGLSLWTPLATLTNTTGVLTYTDSSSTNVSARFYRAQQLP